MKAIILSRLDIWTLEPSEGSHEQQSQRLQTQLNELREALKVRVQTVLPNIPVPSTRTLHCILDLLLNHVQRYLQILLEAYNLPQDSQLHRQTQRQMDLLRHLRQQLQSPNGSYEQLLGIIQSQLGPTDWIVPSGSLKIPLYIHSGQLICEILFMGKERDEAIRLIDKKKSDAGTHGFKIPAYSVCPKYFNYVRCVLGQPFIPSITVDVGQSCNTRKVLIDCIFTIMGTRFLIDAAYAVDLHVDRTKKMLEYIDIYHFDTSLGALVEVENELTGREKAAVSLVIKHKALLKYNDLKVLELLRDWEKSGNTDDESYCKLFRHFSELKVLGCLPYGLALRGYDRAPKRAALYLLKSYRHYLNDMLDQEKSEYHEVVTECQHIVDTYMESEGAGMNEAQLVREGEVILIQKIYERRTSTRVDEHCTESMQFPIKAFTGVKLLNQEFISLFPRQLQDCFYQVAMLFQDNSVDNVEVRLPLMSGLIRRDCFQDVAIMNYPDMSSDEANAALKRAYEASPNDTVDLRVKTCHADVRAQLIDWGIEPQGTEYGNKILFLHEWSKRYPSGEHQEPPIVESSESSQDPSQSRSDLGEQEGDNSDSNDPETSSAGRVRQFSQKPLQPLKRGHSSSSSNKGHTGMRVASSRAETIRMKVRKLWKPPALPKKVSECLDKVPWPRRWLIKWYLMNDEVQSALQEIEEEPEFLRAFKTFLNENTVYIRTTLARPGLLKAILKVLVHNSDNQSLQCSQNCQNSQNSNEAEDIEHEGSVQSN